MSETTHDLTQRAERYRTYIGSKWHSSTEGTLIDDLLAALVQAEQRVAAACQRSDKWQLEAEELREQGIKAEAKLVQAEQEKADGQAFQYAAERASTHWREDWRITNDALCAALTRAKAAEARLASQEATIKEAEEEIITLQNTCEHYELQTMRQAATIRQVAQEMRHADMEPTGSYSNNAPDGLTTHRRMVTRWADTLQALTGETPETKG